MNEFEPRFKTDIEKAREAGRKGPYRNVPRAEPEQERSNSWGNRIELLTASSGSRLRKFGSWLLRRPPRIQFEIASKGGKASGFENDRKRIKENLERDQ